VRKYFFEKLGKGFENLIWLYLSLLLYGWWE